MKLLEGKSLYVRRRIAVIATGTIGILLILIMIWVYTHPHVPKHDPERGLHHFYTIFVAKVQSLFHRK
jgi:hypothetical protein